VLYLRAQEQIRKLAVAAQIGDVAFSGAELTWSAEGVAQSAPIAAPAPAP